MGLFGPIWDRGCEDSGTWQAARGSRVVVVPPAHQWQVAGCRVPLSGQPSRCPVLDTRTALKSRLDLTRLAELDRQFCEFAQLQRHAVPRCGWAKTVRLALGMSSKSLGHRLGISAQGVRKLEQAEADGSISLKTLARLAQGLDCEVHYILVPRTSLMDQVLTRAQERAGGARSAPAQTWSLPQEAQALEALSTLLAQVSRRGFW